MFIVIENTNNQKESYNINHIIEINLTKSTITLVFDSFYYELDFDTDRNAEVAFNDIMTSISKGENITINNRVYDLINSSCRLIIGE